MSEARNNLLRFEAALEGGYSPPPDVSEWLLDGIRQYRTGVPLEKALCLSQPGKVKIATTEARAQQDKWLYAAAEILGLHHDKSNAPKIGKELSEKINRFEVTTWQRIKNHAPPNNEYTDTESITDIKDAITHAFHAGAKISQIRPVPNSPKQITRRIRGHQPPSIDVPEYHASCHHENMVQDKSRK